MAERMLKRRKSAPPVDGNLSDAKDFNKLHAKAVVKNLEPEEIKKAIECATKIATMFGDPDSFGVGGLCSGSGMGELSCESFMTMLDRVSEEAVPQPQHVLSCDNDSTKVPMC